MKVKGYFSDLIGLWFGVDIFCRSIGCEIGL